MSEPSSPPPIECESERRNWVWLSIQTFLRLVFAVCLRYRAHGHEQLQGKRGTLFLINHQSFLDPMLVGLPLTSPVCFLARDSLFRVPVIGWILRHTYVLPINRQAASTGSLREMIARLKAGAWVGIFPEGTRSIDGSLGTLKPGFLALLRRSEANVCLVGIAGSGHALGRDAWFPRFAKVSVVFGTPISAAEIQTMLANGDEQFLKLIHDRLAICIHEAEMSIAAKPRK